MILINRSETDPFFNIAAEEYVLKSMNEDVFMLWVNDPSVIIGKHQVTTAEVDLLYTHEHGIPIIRRISGGGTVYHDQGNLNYSLVLNGEDGKLVDYERYAGTIIRALARHGIEASLLGKSSLATKGMKFSGNAEHVFKKRVLHHGTLLFNSKLEDLRKCIRPEHKNYNDKSVKSVDSKITNLSDHLPPNMQMEDFRNLLIQQIRIDFPGIIEFEFSAGDKENIRKLADEKYSSKAWNFAYSPKYDLIKDIQIAGRNYRLQLSSEKGRISKMSIAMDEEEIMQEISVALVHTLHHPKEINDVLNNTKFADHLNKEGREEFIRGLF
jgi:lipoate-protein ligase A